MPRLTSAVICMNFLSFLLFWGFYTWFLFISLIHKFNTHFYEHVLKFGWLFYIITILPVLPRIPYHHCSHLPQVHPASPSLSRTHHNTSIPRDVALLPHPWCLPTNIWPWTCTSQHNLTHSNPYTLPAWNTVCSGCAHETQRDGVIVVRWEFKSC